MHPSMKLFGGLALTEGKTPNMQGGKNVDQRVSEGENRPWYRSGNFSYIMVPKDLFRLERYAGLSPEAKLLYGFFMDRTSLSHSRGPDWIDAQGQTYIVYPREEVCQRLGCGRDKATRILRELEGAGLIRRSRSGQGRADRIVVLPFQRADGKTARRERAVPPSEGRKSLPPEGAYPAPNKTEPIDPEENHPDCSTAEAAVKANISYDLLSRELSVPILDTIVSIMTEQILSDRPSLTVGGRKWSRGQLRAHMMSLNDMHIRYVFDRLEEQQTAIAHPRRYLLAWLCDADDGVLETYYAARVGRDAALGRI